MAAPAHKEYVSASDLELIAHFKVRLHDDPNSETQPKLHTWLARYEMSRAAT